MTHYRIDRILSHDATTLYQLVGDIESYPLFMPWILDLNVTNVLTTGDDTEEFDTALSVGVKALSEKLVIHVVRSNMDRTVFLFMKRGPFRKFEGTWRFQPQSDGTAVSFDLELTITNPLIRMLFEANYDRIVARLIGCFEHRAAQLELGNQAIANRT